MGIGIHCRANSGTFIYCQRVRWRAFPVEAEAKEDDRIEESLSPQRMKIGDGESCFQEQGWGCRGLSRSLETAASACNVQGNFRSSFS